MLYRPDPPRDIAEAPLTLLPGTLCTGAVFAPMLEALGVFAETLPLSGAVSVPALAARLLATTTGPLSLLGFSLGAIVALEMIAQAPGRIERLALIGCNPGPLSAVARARRAALTRDQFIATQVPPFARTMAAGFTDAEFAAQTEMTLSRADSRPRLAAISVPTLVLCGANDDICPPALSRQLAAAIVGARLAIIPASGHYVTLEQPQAVATEIQAWLAMPATQTLKEPQ